MTAVVIGQDTSAADVPRRRVRPVWVVAGVFLLLLTFLAVFGDVIGPYPPSETNLNLGLSGPSSEHLLGTDALGQDVFSRTLAGARSAIIGPLLIALGALVISNALGLVAGYLGGRVDAVISRAMDLVMSLPSFLVTIVIVGVIGGGYWVAVVLMTFLAVPYDVRVVRAATMEQRTRPYVEASHVLGLRTGSILITQIWPNIVPLVIANVFLDFAFSLVNLSGLAFLGLGSPPGSVDWGRMLADNQTYLLGNVWAPLAPALMIVITATGMNLIGDRLAAAVSTGGQVTR